MDLWDVRERLTFALCGFRMRNIHEQMGEQIGRLFTGLFPAVRQISLQDVNDAPSP
jgi:hypothetical protein